MSDPALSRKPELVSRPPPGLGLRIVRCGDFANRPGRHPPRVVHGFWIAYTVHAAGMAIDDDHGRMHLQPGGCCLVPPWLPVTYHLRQPVPHTYLVFATDALASHLLHDHCDRVHRCRAALPGELLQELSRMLRSPTSTDETLLACRAQAIAHLLMADLLAGMTGGLRSRILQHRHPDDISPALDHIERHLDRPIAVADLATRLGVGVRQCSNLFRRHCACTPMAYLTRRRLEVACTLLCETDTDLTSIAQRCGFGNRHYFSRIFARQFGQGPAAWRQGHR